MKKIRLLCLSLCLCLITAVVLTGCGKDPSSTPDEATQTVGTAETGSVTTDGTDYMVLVNKTHKLPDDWEEKIETVHMTNSIGDDVEVETKAYDAYRKLKAALEEEGIYVDLDSARRSVADQQRIMDEFTEQYGADYAAKTVATPGYSEHHTGLALDLYLIINGKDIVENEDMIRYPEIWAKIHEKLPEYGFILRYLEGDEHITGYGYEPWHIRYLDNTEIAKEITSKGITFEEYLGTASGADVTIDYGSSDIYTKEDLEAAVIQIKCKFAFREGCELHSIRYAGDDAVTDEMLKTINEQNPDAKYTQLVEFYMDFSESDKEYTDDVWLLARADDGGWEIV